MLLVRAWEHRCICDLRVPCLDYLGTIREALRIWVLFRTRYRVNLFSSDTSLLIERRVGLEGFEPSTTGSPRPKVDRGHIRPALYPD